MRELAVDAKVVCADGDAGRVADIVVDRATRSVSHLVVRLNDVAGREFLVPLERVAEASRKTVRLGCKRADLSGLAEFTTTHYVPASSAEAQPVVAELQMQAAMYAYGAEGMYTPLIAPDAPVPIDEHHVPAGAVAIEFGAPVQSSDEQRAGEVVAVLTDDQGSIGHVVVRIESSGPAREVFLPLSSVASASMGLIHVTLPLHDLERLPGVPPGSRYSGSESNPNALHLVSIVFDRVDQADEALHLVQSQHSKIHAAVVRRDAGGSISAHEVNDVSTGRGAMAGAIVGGVLAVAAGPLGLAAGSALGAASGGVVGRVVDRGVPDDYVRELGRALGNNSSALVLLVPQPTEPGILEMLAPMGGRVLRLELDEEMVRQLTTND